MGSKRGTAIQIATPISVAANRRIVPRAPLRQDGHTEALREEHAMWILTPAGTPLLVVFALVVLDLVFLCVAIVRPHRSPASRVAWVSVILLVPVIGIIAYLFLGNTSIGRDRLRRLRDAEQRIPRPPLTPTPELDRTARSAFDLTRAINGLGPSDGNTVVLSPTPEETIDQLAADIDAATDTVHISFYIWLDDTSGTRIVDAIVRAARRGVTCRVMVDALGSRKFLRTEQWTRMRDAGAHTVAALDDLPRLGRLAVGRLDLRNHQKIVVIDDRIAYCGSRNCADPEFRIKPKYAPWVDVFFRLEGPVVAAQQWIFAIGWMVETEEQITPVATAPVTAGKTVAAVFATGAMTPGAMSAAFVTTIESAREHLTITTPYFAPDDALLQAICAAPRRGVKTVMIVPAHNDSALVAAAARSSYEYLLAAGVELYEYPLGLLHSKTMTVDGRLSLVGSANMDRRSLDLNNENNLLFLSAEVTATLMQRQDTYLAASARVMLDEVQAWSFFGRLANNTVAMLSPVL